MKIYLAHPISGLSYEKVVNYFDDMRKLLEEVGYEVLCPMTAKGYLRTEIKFKAEGYKNPISTNHAIFERDQWMVAQCDVLFCDLTGRKRFSIGCTMEIAWGALLGKHVIIAMEQDSEYRHAFMLEAADIVFDTSKEALQYLEYLITGRIE